MLLEILVVMRSSLLVGLGTISAMVHNFIRDGGTKLCCIWLGRSTVRSEDYAEGYRVPVTQFHLSHKNMG